MYPCAQTSTQISTHTHTHTHTHTQQQQQQQQQHYSRACWNLNPDLSITSQKLLQLSYIIIIPELLGIQAKNS